MNKKDNMIKMKSVNKWYGKIQVLNDCSLEVSKGEVIVVCGPSGSGKSTLIRRLVQNLNCFSEIPERRFITLKGIIEPFVSYFNLKCDFNKRQDRIDIVKNYKKNIPEGIVFSSNFCLMILSFLLHIILSLPYCCDHPAR